MIKEKPPLPEKPLATFPELRAVMARYKLTYTDMAQVIGTTMPTFRNKINKAGSEFTFDDMLNIYDFFKSKGEDVSINYLFFAWKFTNVNKAVGE